ncbi:hypothetical protein KCU65_g9839, partial [Aureobasidium melanogenum]
MVHLPNEIWLEVASNLDLPACASEDETVDEHDKIVQQTLVSLCLVSKQLRTIFQPCLYRSFVKYSRLPARTRLLTADSEWLHKYYQRDERTFRTTRKQTRLENFILTMIHRPDLAFMVEQLRVGSFNQTSSLPVHFQKLYERLPLSETIFKTLEKALRTFPGFERLPQWIRRLWLQSLQDGEEEAEVALLLVLLPNLHSLHINSPYGDLGRFVEQLCDVANGPGPRSWTLKSAYGQLRKYPAEMQSRPQQLSQIFAALRSFSVWTTPGGTGSLQRCIKSLSLPLLTSFEANGLEADHKPLETTPNLASLQHLKLVHCKISGLNLEILLGRCTRLQSLEINSEFAFDPEMEMPMISAQFLDNLQKSAGTLERLVPLTPEYYYRAPPDLSSFEKLRYLEIDFGFLSFNLGPPYIHDSLPISLRELTLRRVDLRTKPHLKELFDTFSPVPRFPVLSTLRLYALEYDYDDIKEDLIEMNERAQQCHLEYIFEKEPDHNHWWFWWATEPDSDSELDSERVQSEDEDEDEDEGENADD